MPLKKERQYRSMSMTAVPQSDKLIDSDYYVEGYAANFERYKLFDDGDSSIYEQFTRDNFEGVDLSDVIMQYNHQGEVFARCKNGSLIVRLVNLHDFNLTTTFLVGGDAQGLNLLKVEGVAFAVNDNESSVVHIFFLKHIIRPSFV